VYIVMAREQAGRSVNTCGLNSHLKPSDSNDEASDGVIARGTICRLKEAVTRAVEKWGSRLKAKLSQYLLNPLLLP
jgi:hypothetical protein